MPKKKKLETLEDLKKTKAEIDNSAVWMWKHDKNKISKGMEKRAIMPIGKGEIFHKIWSCAITDGGDVKNACLKLLSKRNLKTGKVKAKIVLQIDDDKTIYDMKGEVTPEKLDVLIDGVRLFEFLERDYDDKPKERLIDFTKCKNMDECIEHLKLY